MMFNRAEEKTMATAIPTIIRNDRGRVELRLAIRPAHSTGRHQSFYLG